MLFNDEEIPILRSFDSKTGNSLFCLFFIHRRNVRQFHDLRKFIQISNIPLKEYIKVNLIYINKWGC
ncbi:TPA: hypothetical protein HNC63_20505 [Escherichia fergusonii]|nr:hypothetical protein VP22_0220105 [Escherichia fergusonii]KWW00972.1 hypothetical protein VK87_0215470 [Escherichia fergusonii]HAJ6532058.1 hypothetical protein [Escherichia fergusonii]HAJ6562055.1 hypothetical protein [Escherichia fergusonii]HAJ6571582.1 hypothetical protein [Escherichia fergusonii]